MQDRTKIQLSEDEKRLVNNTKWILTKHQIIKKVFEMFGEINEVMKEEVEHNADLFPESLKHKTGKISKGDNYELLPYVILDYPSFFWKNNIFAFRTMFWWGNFFSVTLHLSGDNKIKFIDNSSCLLSYLKANNFFICINEEEWQHHFREDNYVSSHTLTDMEYQSIIQKTFFKIAKKLPLTQWDEAPNFIIESFKQIVQILQINFPGDRKVLLPGFPTTGSGL